MPDPCQCLGWLATYLVHSTLLLSAALLFCRFGPDVGVRSRELLLRGAFFGGFVTSGVQCAWGSSPIATWLAFAPIAGATPELVVEPLDEGAPIPTALAGIPPDPGAWLQWAVGAALLAYGAALLGLLLWRLQAGRRLRRLLRHRTPLADHAAHTTLAGLVDAHGGALAGTALSVSEDIRSPLALGWRRPEICLPRDALHGLTASERRGMLAHEFAHLLGRDPLWLFAYRWGSWLGCLQPLNRAVLRLLRDLAEFRCDDFAVDHGCPGTSLASTLLKVAGWQTADPPAAVHAMAPRRSALCRRVQRALHRDEGRGRGTSRWLSLAAGLLLTGFGWGAPAVVLSADAGMPVFRLGPTPASAGAEIEQLRRDLAALMAGTREADLDAETRALLAAIRARLTRAEHLYQDLRESASLEDAGSIHPHR